MIWPSLVVLIVGLFLGLGFLSSWAGTMVAWEDPDTGELVLRTRLYNAGLVLLFAGPLIIAIACLMGAGAYTAAKNLGRAQAAPLAAALVGTGLAILGFYLMDGWFPPRTEVRVSAAAVSVGQAYWFRDSEWAVIPRGDISEVLYRFHEGDYVDDGDVALALSNGSSAWLIEGATVENAHSLAVRLARILRVPLRCELNWELSATVVEYGCLLN